MHNAIITLGDIDDSGKGKRFKSRFIQPGLAGYPGQYGNVLVKKETLDECLNSIIGAPVIIEHQDITVDNADDVRVGVISSAYYNEKDGWYWCEGVIWDETAQNLITDKHWSVSCSYDYLQEDNEGGTENNISYDREFTKLNFRHLALVNNPRYERANIVFNSKTVQNGGDGSGNFDHDGRPGKVGGSASDSGNIVDLSNKFNKTPTIQEVKSYVNELVQKGAKFTTLSPDWYVDLKVNSKAKKHIIYSSEWNKLNRTEKDRHNQYVKDLEKLLNNAEYIGEKLNSKQSNKPNVEKYHYFKTIAKIGQNSYEIIFDTEQHKGDNTQKPQTVHLYNIHEIKEVPVRSGSGKNHPIKHTIGNSNIILADFTPNFNPSVTKHEAIKEQDMALIDELENLIRKVRNNKENNMEKEKDKEVNNEDVDKREILREVDAIAMKPVSEFKGGAEEKFRTITKKLEDLSYNKSSTGTADNSDDEGCKDKEVKNESEKDKDEVKDLEKDLKKDVENSINNSKPDYFERINKIYNAANEPPKDHTEYVSRADRLKAAEEYFG